MKLCKGFLFSAFVMVASTSWAETLTVATFNAEFLYPSKVHIKYGLKFRMGDNTDAEQALWAPPVFRSQKYDQAVDAVAEVLATIDTDVLTLTEVGKKKT